MTMIANIETTDMRWFELFKAASTCRAQNYQAKDLRPSQTPADSEVSFLIYG